jgi:type II secretory pathway pseudopilin PulG
MRREPGSRGFVLVGLLFIVTALAITLAVVIPSYELQSRRDMEEELIFRGAEYARAIGKFRRKYGALPLTVDELMRGSDGVPSLRRRYRDPSSGEEFRTIFVNPDGTLQHSIYPTMQEAQTAARIAFERVESLPGPAPSTVEPGLVGMGSNTDRMSVKVYLGEDRYNRWEFIANPGGRRRTATPPAGNANATIPW